MQRLLAFVLLGVLLVGCSAHVKSTSGQSVLIIQNFSNNDIHVSMTSGEVEETYGDIPSGESKRYVFSPLLFCDYTVIQHKESGSSASHESLLSTTVLANLDRPVAEVVFRYDGNNHWQLILIDSFGQETVVSE